MASEAENRAARRRPGDPVAPLLQRSDHLVGMPKPAGLEYELDPRLPDMQGNGISQMLEREQVGAGIRHSRKQRRQASGLIRHSGEEVDSPARARLVTAG